jgi:hypothetical protein
MKNNLFSNLMNITILFFVWGFVFPRPGIFKAGLLFGCFFSKQCCLTQGEKNKEVPQGTKIEVLI